MACMCLVKHRTIQANIEVNSRLRSNPFDGPPNQKGTTQNNHDRIGRLPARCFIALLMIVVFDIACRGQYNVANSQSIAKYEPCPTM